MFVHLNNKVVNSNWIECIDYKNLIDLGFIRLYYKDGSSETLDGPEAFQLLMDLCPSALEGKRAKYQRHAWAIHNLIGHPLMQVLSWLHLPELGVKIHDATVPNPKLED